MVDLVFWSCVLGFSPIIAFIGWRIGVMAVGLGFLMASDPRMARRVDRLAPAPRAWADWSD